MAIVRDSSVASASMGTSGSASWNHTVASGGVLYVTLSFFYATDPLLTCKFDGTDMTLLKKETSNTRSIYVYGILAPTTGSAKSVAVTWTTTGVTATRGASVSYTGTRTDAFSSVSPVESHNAGVTTSTTGSISTVLNNSILVGMATADNDSITTYTNVVNVGTLSVMVPLESDPLSIDAPISTTVTVGTGSNDWYKYIVVVVEPAPSTHSIDLETSSSQYLSITDAAQTGLDLTGDYTFEAWIKIESAPGSGVQYGILSKWGVASNNSYDFYYYNNGGTPNFTFQNDATGSATGLLSINHTLTTGVWTHVAVSHDASAGTAEMYVNGLSIGSGAGTLKTSTFNGTSPFEIGTNSTGANFFDGLIDDVRVWSDIRTAQEIQDNLDTELVGDEANLVGYWKLNNSLLDETSNNNDLTNNASAVFSTDVQLFDNNTYSMDFEAGSSQYLSIADNASLSLSGDMTIEFWVKPESATGDHFIVSKDNFDTPAQSYWVMLDTNNFIVARWSDDGTNDATHVVNVNTQAAAADVGVWTHIAVTFDISAETVVIYKNGLSVAITKSGSMGASLYDNNIDFVIGRRTRTTPGAYFDGKLDDVRVWSDIRTQTEIRQNMGVKLVGDEAGLVGCWQMNDLVSGLIPDQTSNDNDLTLNASPVRSTDVGYIYDTFFPDAAVESTSVDGNVEGALNATWATVRDNTTGDVVSDTATTIRPLARHNGSAYDIFRGFMLFDTSVLPDTDTIDSATLSLYATDKNEQDSDAQAYIAIVSSTPATDTAVIIGDYDQVGTTDFGNITIASQTASTWSDFVLNASGIANIDATGISKFAAREGHDFEDIAIANSATNDVIYSTADNTDINVRPKLVVIHSAAGGAPAASTIYNVIMF